ncbi:hypothetical protein EYM_01430 [Ignicoccus islandicus DSM 13165]|uniref:Uncharacterized protein n=1 Tax=Ignicoccus islandicus DSM 13165 TaxID=940295 RepID=A0A0U2VDU4_9CREN|nr:hypothetical protein [Ignicoccus islandicus]ALU12210.1 hypothetical protein EYM_01430 [Ignicoccus islandicus DSM 13165]
MEEFVEGLKEAFEKVLCEFTGDCYVCYAKRGNRWYVIGASEGSIAYAKVAPYEDLPPIQNCEGLLAYPKGLFAFAKDQRELAKKVIEKVEKLG